MLFFSHFFFFGRSYLPSDRCEWHLNRAVLYRTNWPWTTDESISKTNCHPLLRTSLEYYTKIPNIVNT